MSKYTNYHRPSKCPNVVGIFLLAFACFLISVIKNFSYPQKLPELDYKIYDSELFPLAVPSKLVVANNTIAVFFEDVGYLSCYSIEGTFLYGIQVDTSLNGRGNFAAVNDMWVI